MMRWYIAIIFSVLWSPSWAQEIVVRTGYHPNFTRIVLSMPPETEWEVNRILGGYTVKVEEPLILNAETFYERIGRDRIASVRTGSTPSEFTFELACDCYVEALQWYSDQLIVDVKDAGTQPSTDARQIADLRATPTIPMTDDTASETPNEPTVEVKEINTQLASVSEIDMEPLNLPLIVSEDGTSPTPPTIIDPFNQLLVQQTRVGSLENEITESLSRALSQGLLAPSNQSLNFAETEDTDSDLAILLDGVEAALSPGIIARTSVDREQQALPLTATIEDEVACIADIEMDIPSWATDSPFVTQISDLRAAITGEFDKTDPLAIEELAKAYITYGFGREAISTLSIDGTASRSRSILRTLAEIIDNDPLTVDDFHLQLGCPGYSAFWGLLAHQEGPLAAQPDVKSIIISFKLLPKPLRQHLAPRLAQKLNALGFQDHADDILSIGDENSIDVAAVELEILDDRGETEEVVLRLTEMAEDDPRLPPEALIKLIHIDLDEERPITADQLTLLRTFQFEIQDEALLTQLYTTEIRALVEMGSYEAAKKLLEGQEYRLSDDVSARFWSDINGRIATQEDDAKFLTFAFDTTSSVSNTRNQNTIAKRLLRLGFPNRAQDFISGEAIGEDMMERRYLRAEASVALGDRVTAEAQLAGITTLRAQEILTNTPISLIMNQITDEPVDDPLLAKIANRIEERTAFQQGTETPLTDGQFLADDATTLRADMQQLLERHQISQ